MPLQTWYRIWDEESATTMTQFKDGEPCEHTGCLSHHTKPCEGCGRIAGKSTFIGIDLATGSDQTVIHAVDPKDFEEVWENKQVKHSRPACYTRYFICGVPTCRWRIECARDTECIDPHTCEPFKKLGMTPEQRDFFVWIAQLGVCCGLDHPLEWLMNYQLHQMNLEVYEDIPARRVLAWETMFAFYKGTGPEFEEMALEQFIAWVEFQWNNGIRPRFKVEPHEAANTSETEP